MKERIEVLDHGYVELIDQLGDDLRAVNAARVSFEKRSYWMPTFAETDDGVMWSGYEMDARDEKLLAYLVRENHTSPFRHAALTFEVYAPLLVMRQWGKYRVGSTWTFEDSDDPIETWNESSRRYVTEEPVVYQPSVWRAAAKDKKQGSGEPVDSVTALLLHENLDDYINRSIEFYTDALAYGVCPEQARLFLPAYGLYVRAYWTVSLAGVIHFLHQRIAHDAQWEIAEFARAVRDLAGPRFPKTFELFGLTHE